MQDYSNPDSLRADLFQFVLNNPRAPFAEIEQQFGVTQLGYHDRAKIVRDAAVYSALKTLSQDFPRYQAIDDPDEKAYMLRDVAATMWARIHNPPATKEDEVADAILGTATLVPDNPAVVSFISNAIVQYISENPPQATWDYIQRLSQRVHEYMLTQPQWPQMLPLSTLAYLEAEPIPELPSFMEAEPIPELPSFSLLKEQVARVLSSLSPEEEKVLELRMGLKDGRSRSLAYVADELGYSNREQVRRVEARALRKIGHRKIQKT